MTVTNMETDPQKLMDDAVFAQIRALQQSGKLPLEITTDKAIPLQGWNIESFAKFYSSQKYSGTSSVPGLPDENKPWRNQLKDELRKDEGFRDRAYHGVLAKNAPRGQTVQEGHGSQEEVSIGYGFNLNRGKPRAGLQEVQQVLGLSPNDAESLYNGKRPVSQSEADKLLDYEVSRLDTWLARETNGYPFRQHQRRALLNMAYNMGEGRMKQLGILQAATAGKDAEVVSRIRGLADKASPVLRSRRIRDAVLYQGAD
jgi:hypothetical protein